MAYSTIIFSNHVMEYLRKLLPPPPQHVYYVFQYKENCQPLCSKGIKPVFEIFIYLLGNIDQALLLNMVHYFLFSIEFQMNFISCTHSIYTHIHII